MGEHTYPIVEAPARPRPVPERSVAALRELAARVPAPRSLASAFAVLVCGASVVTYLSQSRSLWFYSDEWSFLLGRRLTDNTLNTLFQPHNEHWVTIPVIIFRVLFSVFGLSSYAVFMVPLLAAHAGICFLLWSLSRRAGARPWPAAAGVALVSVGGAGAEDLTTAFQIAFVGAVFFGLLALRIVDVSNAGRARLLLSWIPSCCALMCSGVGIPLVAAVVLFALLRAGLRAALLAGSMPVAIYLLWYELYGSAGLKGDSTTGSEKLLVPQFIWTGISAVWQSNTGLPLAGPVLLVLLLAPLVTWGSADPLGRLALAMFGAALLMYAFTGWTRVELGLAQATTSRYIYVGTVLTAPAVVWLLGRAGDYARAQGTSQLPAIATAFVVISTLVNMVGAANTFLDTRKATTAGFRTRIISLEAVLARHPHVLNPVPYAVTNPDISVGGLTRSEVKRAMPHDDAISPVDELEAESHLLVLTSQERINVTAARSVTFPNSKVLRSGCAQYAMQAAAFVDISPSPGGAMVEIATAGTSVLTSLVRQLTTSMQSAWPVSPETTVTIASTATDATLRVTFPIGGAVKICLP